MPFYTDTNTEAQKNPLTTAGGTAVKKKTLNETLAEINANNLSSGSSSIPQLSTYSPDYGSLEKNFSDIQKSYSDWETATKAQADATKASYDTSLAQNIKSITDAKTETTQEYGKSRQQIAGDIYMQNRQQDAAMSARGLTGSGVQALTQIQNRMAQGETVSALANDFNKAQKQLVDTEVATRDGYNNSLLSLNAGLQSSLAQIMNAKASNAMEYQATVENLKQQVINSANAAKQAQYEWQTAQDALNQGSKITNTMASYALANSASDSERIGALLDMGFSQEQAQQTVDTWKSTTSADSIKSVQDAINNAYTLGTITTQAEAKALAQQYITNGLTNLDSSKLVFTKAKTPDAIRTASSQGLYDQMTTNTNQGMKQTGVNGMMPTVDTTTTPTVFNPYNPSSPYIKK